MAVLGYTVQRLLLLLACAGVLYLIGARGILLWAGAFLLSGLLALVLLRSQRDRMSEQIAARRSQPAREQDPDAEQ